MKENFKKIVVKICSCDKISTPIAVEAVRYLCDERGYTHRYLSLPAWPCPENALFNAFEWKTTPQGQDFWSYISDNIDYV